MKKSKIKKSDAIIIIIIFALYIIGYAWMIEPKKKSYKKDDMVTLQTMSSLPRGVEPKEPKPSPPQWPVELGKYFYWIDIDPGYEMEDEEYEVVGESGGNLIVRKHHDWPDISGHFEWYCNEKLTTTQQMFDYVVAHHQAIVRQMREVKKRGLSNPFDEASYYQDHYDDYQDDPEDELRFPPEIFDANDD